MEYSHTPQPNNDSPRYIALRTFVICVSGDLHKIVHTLDATFMTVCLLNYKYINQPTHRYTNKVDYIYSQ